MNLIFFDSDTWVNLLPITLTRPTCNIRVGILTLAEKWQKLLNCPSYSYLTVNYLAKKYPCIYQETNLCIDATILPNKHLIESVLTLKNNSVLISNTNKIIAIKGNAEFIKIILSSGTDTNTITYSEPLDYITNLWEIFALNEKAIKSDFEFITENRTSQTLSSTNTVIGNPKHVFIEEGATVECTVLNTHAGPIYIGRNAEIMEGSLIRGSLALCEGAVLKMASKIYGATTIGPHCKVGGEVSNSVFIGYSNKSHDGFIGNAVIGEWCNFGADSNNSNLKNNYSSVKLWNYKNQSFESTNLQFCGLIMGDHSKTAINSMFNTGTVVGISCNIFGSGFPRNFIPSYTWGATNYELDKATETAELVLARRGLTLSTEDKDILEHIKLNENTIAQNYKLF